jgi:hypothetical protein
MTSVDPRQKQLRRVLRISKINAWSVTIISGGFAVLNLIGMSLVGVLVGGGVAGAGLMEMRGHRRLEAGQSGARQWMVFSQAWLVLCVLAYCGWRLAALDPADPFAMLGDTTGLNQLVAIAGISTEELGGLFIQIYTYTYGAVAALTLVFQGGLGLYYWVRVGRLEGH